MSHKPLDTPHPRLYLLSTGAGFLGLIAWFYAGRELGVLELISQLFPNTHIGAGLMVAIMVLMTPAFLVWKFYNRWVESKLKVTGKYLEDDVYLPPKKGIKKPE